jgi:hypothetical protein
METLDPKKKKIYIGIIAACMLLTAGVLMYGFGGGSGTPAAPAPMPGVGQSSGTAPASGSAGSAGPKATGQIPLPSGKVTYPAPTVFPSDPKFDLSVYQSGDLDSLTDYVPLAITDAEVGRENPFLKY